MIWKYLIAWFGMMILAIINGAFRDSVYKKTAGDLAAHQMSTYILLGLLSIYFYFVVRVIPFESMDHAWLIGLIWFVMTEIFEFGMGLYSGKSWSELFNAYNLLAGQIWLLIPLWVLFGPPIFYKMMQMK